MKHARISTQVLREPVTRLIVSKALINKFAWFAMAIGADKHAIIGLAVDYSGQKSWR